MKKKISSNIRAIWAMLSENTGAHFLDSGGAYGRVWERNQKCGLEAAFAEPAAKAEFYHNEHGMDVTITLSTLHYLDDAARYLPQRTSGFLRFANSMPDDPWEEVIGAYTRMKGWKELWSEYTYSVDNLLSQDVIVVCVEDKCGDYLYIIRSHNGCDARSGFSSPKFFEPREQFEEYSIAENWNSYTATFDGPPIDTTTTTLPGIEEPKQQHLVIDSSGWVESTVLDSDRNEVQEFLGVPSKVLQNFSSWPGYLEGETVPDNEPVYWQQRTGEWRAIIAGKDFGPMSIYPGI